MFHCVSTQSYRNDCQCPTYKCITTHVPSIGWLCVGTSPSKWPCALYFIFLTLYDPSFSLPLTPAFLRASALSLFISLGSMQWWKGTKYNSFLAWSKENKGGRRWTKPLNWGQNVSCCGGLSKQNILWSLRQMEQVQTLAQAVMSAVVVAQPYFRILYAT